MLRADQVTDIDTLRQMAVLLERENEKLHERLRKLTEEVSRLRGEDGGRLQAELDFLKELLARREQALFGDSSEKRSRPDTEKKPPASSSPRRGHGPKAQPELPILEKIHELDEADRACRQCGGALQEMGQFEESEEVTVVERSFVVVKHLRKKYRCRCNGCVETALGPPKLKAGCRYSPEFAVEVVTSKYLDHIPLERQVRIMAREGLSVDSQTLWDQTEAVARLLAPSARALLDRVLASELVHADESWWRLMETKAAKRWWAWSVGTEEAVCYKILDSRSQEAAREVLGNYHGIVMADGYGAYGALARAGPGFTLAHCWAHVRRKFVEIEENYPEPCREILSLIGKLYEVEREATLAGEKADVCALRAVLRSERSRGIVSEIRSWAFTQRALPESGLGRAIAYMLGMWRGLTLFLDDPRVPLDNNLAERGLRGLVVGRKNHFGSRSRRGTEVAALFYSLIESAKLAGVDPKVYLLKAVHAAITDPNAVTLPADLLA
jgi:transposase